MHMHICTALLVYALVHALSFALVITLIASPAPPRLARLSRRIASLHWLKHSCASQHAHMHCLVGNALRAPCLCCTRAHSCASHAQCVHAHAHMHRLVGSALCAPCLCCTRGCSFMCITCTVCRGWTTIAYRSCTSTYVHQLLALHSGSASLSLGWCLISYLPTPLAPLMHSSASLSLGRRLSSTWLTPFAPLMA
jgi:hypothetical protein